MTLVGIQDVADVQRAVAPDNPSDVVLVGLCSGGYHCSEAALSTGAVGVVMINPSFRLLGVEAELDTKDSTVKDLERKSDEAPRAWVQKIPGRAALWELVRRAPDPLWTVINRLAISHPPAETLKQMRDTGTDVFVPCDDYDAWVLQRGARRQLDRTNRPGRRPNPGCGRHGSHALLPGGARQDDRIGRGPHGLAVRRRSDLNSRPALPG